MTRRLSWAVRLERAEKRGKFTEFEVGQAMNYLTCAIGERHSFPRIDEDRFQSILTKQELDLGYLFYYMLFKDNIPEAKRIYAEIQALP